MEFDNLFGFVLAEGERGFNIEDHLCRLDRERKSGVCIIIILICLILPCLVRVPNTGCVCSYK